MQKLISIDLFADFGMLKKPDTNEPVYLTFNMLHRPALLGIVGAIIGEGGFKEKGVLPDYYLNLNENLKIGIRPLNHENGNFQKTIITYNNTTGMASQEEGGNLMVTEQTLISPAFCCYFLLDLENELHKKIDENFKNQKAEYIPYLGKNEFSAWWENYTDYPFDFFTPSESFKIASMFVKEKFIKEGKEEEYFDLFSDLSGVGNSFMYFERLPIGYEEIAPKHYQYEYENFAYTDWSLKQNYSLEKYPLLKLKSNEQVIQVF